MLLRCRGGGRGTRGAWCLGPGVRVGKKVLAAVSGPRQSGPHLIRVYF